MASRSFCLKQWSCWSQREDWRLSEGWWPWGLMLGCLMKLLKKSELDWPLLKALVDVRSWSSRRKFEPVVQLQGWGSCRRSWSTRLGDVVELMLMNVFTKFDDSRLSCVVMARRWSCCQLRFGDGGLQRRLRDVGWGREVVTGYGSCRAQSEVPLTRFVWR